MTFNFGWKSWNWHSWSWSGYCKPKNARPVDCDDKAKVCAGESVKIDVLSNDYDKEDSRSELKIMIGDAVLDHVGETVTLANGATVTLGKYNKLIYNSGDAFDSLSRGQKAIDTFHYKLIDTDGAVSDGAKVAVTVCGATDTLAEIGQSLPDTIEFKLHVLEDVGRGLGDARLTLSGSNPADSRFDNLVIDAAYCIFPDGEYVDGAVVKATVHLADAASAPAGAIALPENLDSISWILNERFGEKDNGDGAGETYTEAEIQAAIWRLCDGVEGLVPGAGALANANEIYEAALANGNGFTPGEGDIVALLLVPTAKSVEQTGHEQPFVIGVSFEDLKQDCDCGTHHSWWC